MENRDEPTRISVGTVHDWQKLKANYREAVLQSFQAALNTAHHPERDAMLAYIDEVCPLQVFYFILFFAYNCFYNPS